MQLIDMDEITYANDKVSDTFFCDSINTVEDIEQILDSLMQQGYILDHYSISYNQADLPKEKFDKYDDFLQALKQKTDDGEVISQVEGIEFRGKGKGRISVEIHLPDIFVINSRYKERE